MMHAYYKWWKHLLPLALVYAVLLGCRDQPPVVPGRWVSEQSSIIALYFYPDGTASLSGTGLLKLQWKEVEPRLVRIEALDRKLVFHFRMVKDSAGYIGTLELAGYDAMVFRKRN